MIHPSKDGHIITYIDACAHILTENWYKKKAEVGLCASYDEIRLFEASLLLHSGSEEKKEMYKDAYIQMVFDNADNDVRTIDGKNTFHVEGGIKILTPGNVVSGGEPIIRLKRIPKSSVLGEFGKHN